MPQVVLSGLVPSAFYVQVQAVVLPTLGLLPRCVTSFFDAAIMAGSRKAALTRRSRRTSPATTRMRAIRKARDTPSPPLAEPSLASKADTPAITGTLSQVWPLVANVCFNLTSASAILCAADVQGGQLMMTAPPDACPSRMHCA